MINLGTSTMQDFALGDNLVERIDLGDTTIFDPYTTLTGALPLTFNSRVAGALKNYRLYGDSDGAGEETENLVNVEQWLDDRGATYTFSDGTYTIDAQSNLYSSPCYFSQENIVVSFKGKISNVTATSTRIDAINADGTLAQRYVLLAGQTSQTENISCAGFRMDWSATGKIALSRFMVVKGSTAPTTFIPFGYKIPISNTSGEQQSNYDLFVGDSKLYEDEYLDFVEQKIYRTILLTTHDNKDFITSDNKRFCVRRSNNG